MSGRATILHHVNKNLKVLDIFAGAGGLSEGFARAGCDIVAHIERDRDACETIRSRLLYHALKKSGKLEEYKKYVLGEKTRDALVRENSLQKEICSVINEEISQKSCPHLILKVQELLKGKGLDIVIGGPPCQAYSNIGRSSDRRKMKRDQRKFLYQYYVEFLRKLRPKLFVFENVPGLISAGNGFYLKDMRRLMKKIGYTTDYQVLNAADFGVPQNRKRVILIGWRNGLKILKYPTFQKVERNYTVADFLTDLPAIKAGEGARRMRNKKRSNLLESLGITDVNFQILSDHIARPQSNLDLGIYRIAIKKKSAGTNLRYSELPPRLKTYKNETVFLDRFKVVDFSAKASHTVIAHIAKDGHYYIHPDIKQGRALTVREAARLQTFPDDFLFEGSRTSQFKQIGNAVPPVFSRVIADGLIRYLR